MIYLYNNYLFAGRRTRRIFNSKKNLIGHLYYIFINYIYPKKHALFMFSLFGITYIREQLFSRMKNTKSKNRSTISHKHLESCLRIASTSIDPDIDSLLSQKKQLQISH
jgi:hypothetical protein